MTQYPPNGWSDADGATSVLRVSSQRALIRAARTIDHPLLLNAPLERRELTKLASLLGSGAQVTRTFSDVREIRYDPGNTVSIAEGVGEHPMHTDGTFMDAPPSSFMLYFLRTDPEGGGVSWLLPGEDILANLEAEDVEALTKLEVCIARADQRGFVDSWQGKLMSYDSLGRWRLRWRYDEQVRPEPVDDPSGRLARAIERVRELCEDLPRTIYAASEGDLLLVPNHSWLHGRSALSTDSSRVVLRVWIA